MKRKCILSCLCFVCTLVLIVVVAGCAIAQPTFRHNHLSTATVDATRLNAHVVTLSETFHPRNWEHVDNLDKCADYIAKHFSNAGAVVTSQVFTVRGRQYKNVIGRFLVGHSSKVVVGAHYDSCGATPGADDNASGIAALIELAYLFGRSSLSNEVELVGYTLEEPPFFGSQSMGSAIHAESLAGEVTNIVGVIVLDMVGYFSGERGSQSYPSGLLRLIYPSSGNFIGVVGPWAQSDWIKRVKTGMKGCTDLPVYSIRAPVSVPGIDHSDHRCYWPYDLKAVMVTDTAFYRNREYHSLNDTADRLDYERMSKVVVSLFEAVRSL